MNLLSVTSLETYLNSEDSYEDSCDTLTINVPVKTVGIIYHSYLISIHPILQSMENVPYQRQSRNLWENVQQKLAKVKQEEEGSTDESGTKQAFLGDPFQEMTYEEIAIWIDTRARYGLIIKITNRI